MTKITRFIDFFNISLFCNIFSKKISIYPNPSSEVLFIDFKKKINQVDIEVFDVLGVLSQRFHFSNEHKVKIDISHLSEGIHFINFRFDNGRFSSSFIKI